ALIMSSKIVCTAATSSGSIAVRRTTRPEPLPPPSPPSPPSPPASSSSPHAAATRAKANSGIRNRRIRMVSLLVTRDLSCRALVGTVTDGRPVGRVEELQGAGVDHELDGVALAHLGARIEAGQDGRGPTLGVGVLVL